MNSDCPIKVRAASVVLTVAVAFALGAFLTEPAEAQTFTVLHNFTGSPDGKYPAAAVVRDAAGGLYGTAAHGGSYGGGTVFKLDASGTLTVLHSFAGSPSDGEWPFAPLIRDSFGNLYGTTAYGGTSNFCSSGCGTVFKIDTAGTETLLHSFDGADDGGIPFNGLVRDAAGNLYGTAADPNGYGEIFKLDTSGTLTLLYRFDGYDGSQPNGLSRDKAGNLYGTTTYGPCGGYTCGLGEVFEFDTDGKLTVLHTFNGGNTDGCFPFATPALDSAGNLYGSTWKCGSGGVGTVWKVSKTGKETILHNFMGGPKDGEYSEGSVIRDREGNLYGDTAQGSIANSGTIYKLSTRRALMVLHSLLPSDGLSPSDLIRDAKGNLYGTAWGGGSNGDGTVWKLIP